MINLLFLSIWMKTFILNEETSSYKYSKIKFDFEGMWAIVGQKWAWPDDPGGREHTVIYLRLSANCYLQIEFHKII